MNQVTSESLDDFELVRLSGEVDLSWSMQVRRVILAALSRGVGVAVDLSQVSYIDSSGIAALVEGFQNARQSEQRFVLVAASRAVVAVLELARLDRVFRLAPTLEALRGS